MRRFVPITCVFMLSVWSASLAAQSASAPQDEVERLTFELVAGARRALAAAAADRAAATAELVRQADARQQLLASLVETDPGAVLKYALPPAVLASMPEAARPFLETAATLEGTIEVQVEDHRNGSIVRRFLDLPGRRLSLHFAGSAPALLTGARVRVRGILVGDALALQSGGNSVQSLSAGSSAAIGEQRTLVMLVNFKDNASQPYSSADAYATAFGVTSDYDREASSGQTWLTGDVAGWFTIPVASTSCDTSAIAKYAQQAASGAGYSLNRYSRYVYAFPQNACGWWGLGTIGGSPSQAWINGSLQLKVLAHEMGHNFGLYHAHSLDCGADSIGDACSLTEYGDTIDMMGLEAAGHFTAFAKERLGWLNTAASPAVTTVTTSGSYYLEPYAASGFGPKALKILKSGSSAGQRTWYYVEFRQPVGFDAFLGGNANVTSGVVIHTGAESSGDSSDLLDMTPATDSWYDPALGQGPAFSDAAAGISIAVRSTADTGAALDVTVGEAACVRSAPALSIVPSQTSWVTPGSTLAFDVAVTDNDSAACPASTFMLSDLVPAGWVATFDSQSLPLQPGGRGATVMHLTVPSDTPDGMYAAAATAAASDLASLSATASVDCAVTTGLAMQVGSDQTTYSRNQVITLSATAMVSAQPAANVAVTFTLTRPDGSIVRGSSTTDATGAATFSLKLKGNYPAGTWRADASGTLSGLTASASTTFVAK